VSADDDVQKSRSYYRAELETAKTMLAPWAGHERMLVVVDQLFRGTNTSERIGAGAALLATPPPASPRRYWVCGERPQLAARRCSSSRSISSAGV
jgi:hypothetical protein